MCLGRTPRIRTDDFHIFERGKRCPVQLLSLPERCNHSTARPFFALHHTAPFSTPLILSAASRFMSSVKCPYRDPYRNAERIGAETGGDQRVRIWTVIPADFSGDGAGVCREVMARDGVPHTAERFTTWGVPCSGGRWFPGLSLRWLSLSER